jgi:hypothetical protein
LLWVEPRLGFECQELKVIAEELSRKYGKEFAKMCRKGQTEKINKHLMEKLSEQVPDDLLVEKYIFAIAKSYNVPFKAKPEIAVRDPEYFYPSHCSQISGTVPEAPDLKKINYNQPYISSDLSCASMATGASAPPPLPLFPPAYDFDESRQASFSDSFDNLEKRFNNIKKN